MPEDFPNQIAAAAPMADNKQLQASPSSSSSSSSSSSTSSLSSCSLRSDDHDSQSKISFNFANSSVCVQGFVRFCDCTQARAAFVCSLASRETRVKSLHTSTQLGSVQNAHNRHLQRVFVCKITNVCVFVCERRRLLLFVAAAAAVVVSMLSALIAICVCVWRSKRANERMFHSLERAANSFARSSSTKESRELAAAAAALQKADAKQAQIYNTSH